MKHQIAVKERESGAKIEITNAQGKMYRITIWDSDDEIIVNCVDGAMLISPYMGNEVKISTKP